MKEANILENPQIVTATGDYTNIEWKFHQSLDPNNSFFFWLIKAQLCCADEISKQEKNELKLTRAP